MGKKPAEKSAACAGSAFWSAAGKAGCFRAFQFGKQSQQSRVGESRKQKAEKVCFLKVGELWPLPIVAAYESAPSKFTSQPNHTNLTHAPKYRLSESEFTNTYVINIIYINIAVKSLKI